MSSICEYNYIFNKYNLDKKDIKYIYHIIRNIFEHDEFQRRLTKEFYHHGTTTLGEHILEDTVVTYILCKKSNKKVNLEYALKIAMMHDLYTKSWQNSGIKKQHFFHKHGFSHPIEAVINSINWFNEEFYDNYKSRVLIDGIVHHMYPLPVMCFNDCDINYFELNNYELLKNISYKLKKIIIASSNKNKINDISLCKSEYMEGRIMSHADKIVSFNQLENVSSTLALVTGKNKSLYNKYNVI